VRSTDSATASSTPGNERFVESGPCQERPDSSLGAEEDRPSFDDGSAIEEKTTLGENIGHEDEASAKGVYRLSRN
jgi:hypothetical protein